MSEDRVARALKLLDSHYKAFMDALDFANATGHPVPSDTKAWSQILVSTLTGLSGRKRKKGSDLDDGSDVKGANVWSAIDTPRFNGAIPAGRKSATAKKAPDVTALDGIPYTFFVLWDEAGEKKIPRCRVWCVRPKRDAAFRKICEKWYKLRAEGKIVSDNFQLHPPRNQDHNVFRNECGNLTYPLLFTAIMKTSGFARATYEPSVLVRGRCAPVSA